MKTCQVPLKCSSSLAVVVLAILLTAAVNLSAQDVPATSAADALDNLKTATLNKMDWEVENTARAFADAQNIHNSLVWSDWARPFLDIALAVYSGLTAIPNLETGGARQYLHTAIGAADSGKSYYSIYTSLDRFRQDGVNLALAIDGPSYNGIVSAMLDRADASSFFFNYTLFMNSIQSDLNGAIPANCPIRISHKSTEYDRTGGSIFTGKLQARNYVESQFNALSTLLRQTQLPQQRVNELVAFIQARRQEILQSGSAPGMGVSHVTYDAYLTKSGVVTKRKVSYNLGTISQLEQWRLKVLDLFIQTTGSDMIGLTGRLVEKAGDFVIKDALTDLTESVNLNLNVEAVISGQAGANIVLKDATSLGISIATPDIGVLADQAQAYVSNSREQINMIPQQMMDGLPGEISKVLLLTDDTVKYAQLTIAAPVVAQVTPGTLPTSASAQHIVVTGQNFKPSSDPNASKFIFTDPANNTYIRTPTFASATEMSYDITVLSAVGTWTVRVANGAVESLPTSFTVAPAAAQLTGLSVSAPASMAENSSVQLTATATIGGVQQTVTPVWHENSTATDISAAGVLTASEVAGDTSVDISCDYTFNGVTKSASASVTVLNSSSGGGGTVNQELVTNGGAESGNTSGWQMSGPIVGVNPTFPYAGYYYYVLGELNSVTDTMWQSITIPANSSTVTFNAQLWVYSEDTSSTAVDTFTATVRDANNNVLAILGQRSNLDKVSGTGQPAYRNITYDLSSLRGQTVKLYFTAQLNSSGFTSFKLDNISVMAAVTQSSCTFSLSLPGDIWAAAGGSDAFNVIAASGCSWSTSVNVNWVHITSGSSGTGTHGVFYTVDANPTTTPRSGVITAAGQFFTINQNGNQNACVFRLSSPGYAWPAAGGSDSFSVLADAICWWEAKANATWITISTNEGTGTASISYTVQPNTASGSRMGTITAAGQAFTINQAGTPPPPGSLASGLSYPSSIAVDDTWVYWTEAGRGVVKKVLKTGGSETTIISTNWGTYGSIALSDTDIFLSNLGINIVKVPKNGGVITTLYSTNQDTIEGITLRDGLVYWAGHYQGMIFSMPMNGGPIVTVATGPAFATGIQVTDTAVFWSLFNNPGSVFKQPKGGGTAITLSSTTQVNPGLLVQGGWVYWTAGRNIYRIPVDGGTRQTCASNLSSAWRMAADGTNLFWVEFTSPGGCVKQMPLDGGPIITLATNLVNPTCLAVDERNVYWTEGDNRSPGSIKWVAKAIIQPDTIAPQVYVSAPLTGARVSDPALPVSGTAVDDVAVSVVEFQINGGVWNTASGTTNWTGTATLQVGTNAVSVHARDTSGNTSSVASVTVVYLPPDVTAPTLTILSPTTNATFFTSDPAVSLGGQATDNVGVQSVLWANERGGNGAAALAGSTWTSGPVVLLVGQNNLTVTATDAAGNSKQAQIIVDRLSAAHNTLGFVGSLQPGQFQFRFYGQPRAAYEIQASTNMVYWFSVGTNIVPVGGYFDFTRAVLVSEPNAFFRVKVISP
ncbi:MAG: hypothetical protein KIS67_08195 [Verrucomicrobiae bacterium]|nr:hypothetical protein [Verrucomicrobiae bacterium]